MECPHLEEHIINVKQQLEATRSIDAQWRCSACGTAQSPWVCLTCGVIHCGRYINGHAKQHYETNAPHHCISMDCDNWTVYCYCCDDFVINDTLNGLLGDIRQYLSDARNADAMNDTKENKIQRRRNSSGSPVKKKKKTTDQLVKPRASGLRNLGNTCFMNAVLQSLSNIQFFYGYIKQLPSFEQKLSKKVNTRSCKDKDDVFVVEELRKTVVALWQGGKGAIAPDALFSAIWKVVPRFRGYQQQDAHEFMRYLLDRLHTELLTLLPYPESDSPFIGPKSRSTIVTNIFGGQLQSEVQCLVCRCNSKKLDPFLDLSLDIPAKFTQNDGEQCECTLTDCLSSFTELEELEESELYMCTHCKERQRSTKRFWIKRLPKVLCLHLKRFRWSAYHRVKIDTYVRFPLRGLDVSKFVLNEHGTRHSGLISSEYDLAAVIVHHGTGAGSGHYTSYAIQEGRWHHFNDSKVSTCDETPVINSKAYILFYVKRDTVPNSVPS